MWYLVSIDGYVRNRLKSQTYMDALLEAVELINSPVNKESLMDYLHENDLVVNKIQPKRLVPQWSYAPPSIGLNLIG